MNKSDFVWPLSILVTIQDENLKDHTFRSNQHHTYQVNEIQHTTHPFAFSFSPITVYHLI